jgi:ubiquinone/menaquinone biosynthesis C-methylase UbiE
MNLKSYDAISPQWDAVRLHLSQAEAQLFALVCQKLIPGSPVLDLGCGTGRPIAQFLIDHGLQVTGVDQSVNMLEWACK